MTKRRVLIDPMDWIDRWDRPWGTGRGVSDRKLAALTGPG